MRGSTVLVPTVAERQALAGAKRGEQVLTYGTRRVADPLGAGRRDRRDRGRHPLLIVSSGLAAVTTPLLAFLKAGDHCLMPDTCTGRREISADGMLRRYGVETTYYDPCIDEAGIAALMRPNTTVVYTESPGSHTFEVQDVPAIARAAHARRGKGDDGQHLGHPPFPAVRAWR